MHVMSIETLAEAESNLVHDVSNRLASTARGTLADDVRRIVDVAAQLFSAIERQTHQMEEELVIACGEQVRPFVQTAFQERMTVCAQGLDTSLQEIAVNLQQRAL
jgi:hypothetical protein